MTAVQYDVRCPLCRGHDPGLRAREVTLQDVLRDFLPIGGTEPSILGDALVWTPMAATARPTSDTPRRVELFPGMSAAMTPMLPQSLPPGLYRTGPATPGLATPELELPAFASSLAPSPPAMTWPWFDEVDVDVDAPTATPLRDETRLLLLSPAPRRHVEATTSGDDAPGPQATASVLLVRHSGAEDVRATLAANHDHLSHARAERRRYLSRRRRVLRTDPDLLQRHERVRREERDVVARIRAIESHYASLTRHVWRTDPTLVRMRHDYRRARNAMGRHRRDLRTRLHAHIGDDPWDGP